jgi:hypothetical protein
VVKGTLAAHPSGEASDVVEAGWSSVAANTMTVIRARLIAYLLEGRCPREQRVAAVLATMIVSPSSATIRAMSVGEAAEPGLSRTS